VQTQRHSSSKSSGPPLPFNQSELIGGSELTRESILSAEAEAKERPHQNTQDQANETNEMNQDTVHVASDALTVSPLNLGSTTQSDNKNPVSIAEAGHKQRGDYSATLHSEGTPVTETTYAKNTELDPGVREPNLQPPGQAQLSFLRGIDEAEDQPSTRGSSNQVIRAIRDVGESLLELKTAYKNSREPIAPVHGRVFGVPLHVSILYASVDLIRCSTFDGSHLNGRIPLIVARCCGLRRASRQS
jgi:hypothetical protein